MKPSEILKLKSELNKKSKHQSNDNGTLTDESQTEKNYQSDNDSLISADDLKTET